MIEIAARSISASRRARVRRVDRIGQTDVGDARRRRTPPLRRPSRSRCRPRRARSAIARRPATCGSWREAAARRRRRRRAACTRSMLRRDRARDRSGPGEWEDQKAACGNWVIGNRWRNCIGLVCQPNIPTTNSPIPIPSEQPREPRRAACCSPGKSARGSGHAEVPRDDFAEDVAEIGGDREVAAFVALLDRQARPLAVDVPAADAAADRPSSRCRGRGRCRGCRSRSPRGRTPTSSGRRCPPCDRRGR